MSALDSTRTDSTKARDVGAHPWRSLALSALAHVAFVALLALIPEAPRAAATRARRASVASIDVVVARARAPIAWPVEREPLEEVREPALDVELPSEVVDATVPPDLWFDEPPPVAVPRGAPISVAQPIFADLPEDLFAAPVAEPDAAPPVEPDAAPPEDVVEAPPDEDPAPDTPEDAPPTPEEESPSDPAPDVAGEPTDEAPEESDAEDDEDASEIGAGEAESHLLDAPPPRYPAAAKAMGKQGTVVLAIDVDASGAILFARVKESSGHRVLDEAARQFVLAEWRFRARKDGEPDLRRFAFPIVFRLTRR